MFKKVTAILLSAIFAATVFVGCSDPAPSVQTTKAAETTKAPETTKATEGTTGAPVKFADGFVPTGGYKIGIITGTVSQGEEELRAAEKMKADYPDIIETATYPDNFANEQQQVIQTIKTMAQVPNMKAIIMLQAVPGAKAAFEEIRANEATKDILLLAGVPQEAPDSIAAAADMIMSIDEVSMAAAVVDQAKAMGAKRLIHYSFARHMSMETLSLRRDLMKKACEEQGLEFIYKEAVDPMGEQGIPGAQAFVKEDAPKLIQQLGKDTAFFATNCAMQEPLVKAVLDGGALYPQQCCPSPLHAYPAVLQLKIAPEKMGDIPFIVTEIGNAFKEQGGEGRFATWAAPMNMAFVQAGAMYGMEYAEAKVGKDDVKKLQELMEGVTGKSLAFSNYEGANGKIPNYHMILSEFITF